MNCLSDKEIQEYIDGECDNRQELEQHLQQCVACTKKLEKQKQFLKKLIDEYNQTYNYSIIPEFRAPQTTLSRAKNLKTRILIVATAAAAVIFFFLMIAPDKPEKQPDLTMFYELEMEVDANKPFPDQNVDVVIYFDSEERLFR